MDRQALLAALIDTLHDGAMSRSEKRALRAVLADRALGESERAALRAELVDHAAGRLNDPRDRAVVAWLGTVLSMLVPPDTRSVPDPKVCFGPEDPMVETLQGLVSASRTGIDIAVFTLTDDRLSDALIAAHRRGVQVRILTDDDKQWDSGSDVQRLERGGIEVARDRSPHHFHHKFALFDRKRLATGSYNWTRGADRNNRENFLVTEDPALVRAFAVGFDKLWAELA